MKKLKNIDALQKEVDKTMNFDKFDLPHKHGDYFYFK